MPKTSLLIPIHVLGLAALSLFFRPAAVFELEETAPRATAAEAADARETVVRVAEMVLQAHFKVTSVVEVVPGEQALRNEDVSGTFGEVRLKVDVKQQRALARITLEGGDRAFLMLLKRQAKKAPKPKTYAA